MSNNGQSPRHAASSNSMRAPSVEADRRRSPTPSRTTPLHASLPQKPAASTSVSSSAAPRHAFPSIGSSSSNRGRGRGGGGGVSNRNNDNAKRRTSTGNDHEEQEKRARKLLAYGEEVYSIQEDSIREDWSLNYLNTGRRPQNLLQGTKLEERFSEYPKLAKLLAVHSELVKQHACSPTYLSLPDLRSHASILPQTVLPTKFDCVLIDLPLEEYAHTYPGRFSSATNRSSDDTRPVAWTWDEISALPIPQVANNPGFIWLWVGSGKADAKTGISGLDKGRELLAKWGYRRCEDIVWLKTNTRKSADGKGLSKEPPTSTLMTHTKEHCLMGIRGTVRRSTDGHFVHCNVDTDVIVWEGDETDPLRKPPELYNMIENFCMGTRRLELCSNSSNTRPGWLTVGASPALASSEAEIYNKQAFDGYFANEASSSGLNIVPTTAEVESLRPRSPGPPGGAGKSGSGQPGSIPGLKSNPQGIGRHTNRSATPSASQQLELQQIQAQQMAEMERQRQVMEEQQRQQAQMQQQQQMQMQQQQQQQQWAMQQAQFMNMFQHSQNPMMAMMPQQGGIMGMPGMLGMQNPYAFQQFPQQQQYPGYPQGFPQQQQSFGGNINQVQGNMNGQYGYGSGYNQQYQSGQQQ